MREKKQLSSYLNQRCVKPDVQDVSVIGVQAEPLTQPTVSIASDVSASANPYSILTKEFTETKTRAAATFVVDTAEISKNEVKLPQKTKDEPVEKVKKAEKRPAPIVKEEIPLVEASQKPMQMSDMALLNSMNVQPEAPAAHSAQIFDIPEGVELFAAKEEDTSNDLQILNDLQIEENNTKKSKNTKQEISAAQSGLAGLLAELSDEDGSSDLGIG